jgi:outer membrane protein TolC
MAQELLDAPPQLMAARRLSKPSIGAASYAQRVKQALITIAQDYPEVQTAQAAANTSSFGVDAAKKARYPRFKMGTASGTYNSGAANA